MRRVVSAREQVEMLSPWRLAADPRTMGVNINDTVQDYTGQILRGDKTMETRNSRSLHPYVGRQVGIVRTHKSRNQPTMLVGYASVGDPKFYGSREDFDADYHLHQVGPDSPHHINHSPTGTKWGYPMHDVLPVDPKPVHSRGNVAREVPPPPAHTAAKPRRFNQDWQHIGGDYFPLDVISHYMDRKGEGFGDEKAPLYEMNGKPPLSQQIDQNGYEKPVELATDGKSGVIYDGHHRIDVARQLGHTHVPVTVSWRNSSGYDDGAYGNKIEPWLKGWLTDMRKGRETVGRRLAVLSDEDRVSVAEHVMEDAGLAGKSFHVPNANIAQARERGYYDQYGQPDVRRLQREHSAEAEQFVNGILQNHGHDGDIRISPNHWDLREPGAGQAFTDGNKIGLAGQHANALTLLHETAHILTNTDHRDGHGPLFQKTLHGLYHQHLGPEAADTFAGIAFAHQPHTAAADKTLEQHLRDTYEPYPPGSPNLPDDLKPHLMLPTDIAHHYREFDRPDDENTQMLKRVIADQGIRQPLKISTDGTHALMIEGNHRLNVARQLGISHVPVRVFVEKPGEVMANESYSKPVPLEPHLGEWINQNRHHLKSFWS